MLQAKIQAKRKCWKQAVLKSILHPQTFKSDLRSRNSKVGIKLEGDDVSDSSEDSSSEGEDDGSDGSDFSPYTQQPSKAVDISQDENEEFIPPTQAAKKRV